MAEWSFYGRTEQLERLGEMLNRSRWFFANITGRRRIGKTALIQQSLTSVRSSRSIFYVQIPDSEPAGVLSAFVDALDTFAVPNDRFPRPSNFAQLAKLIESMAESNYAIVLDEFQYFHRKSLSEFCSFLQTAVDRLSARSHGINGGLVVLGSIQTEMAALLDNRSAPLFNRVTDKIDLPHLDAGSTLTMLRAHTDATPERLLFLWNLFEGVPKFYRDCYEQGVLPASRPDLLRRMFFESSSPLRTEAENWFLRELRGRYDIVLKEVARNPGRSHGDLVDAVRRASGDVDAQIGGYLKVLIDSYAMIEKRLPVFAKPDAKRNRYYISDNFLRSWLAALAGPVSATAFRPMDDLIAEADRRLEVVEGGALEKLAGQLYEERSRRGIGDFPLGERVHGYWDKAGTEIDLVALNSDEKRIRFGSSKRSPSKLLADVTNFRGHVARFLEAKRGAFDDWTVEYVGIAPVLTREERRVLERYDVIPQDLNDLTAGLS